MTHIAIAILFQIFFGLISGRWGVGAIAASAFFIGREITQAEYRWIEEFGGGKRANMPWWGGFDVSVWNFKSFTDAFLPLIFTYLIYLIATWISK